MYNVVYFCYAMFFQLFLLYVYIVSGSNWKQLIIITFVVMSSSVARHIRHFLKRKSNPFLKPSNVITGWCITQTIHVIQYPLHWYSRYILPVNWIVFRLTYYRMFINVLTCSALTLSTNGCSNFPIGHLYTPKLVIELP